MASGPTYDAMLAAADLIAEHTGESWLSSKHLGHGRGRTQRAFELASVERLLLATSPRRHRGRILASRHTSQVERWTEWGPRPWNELSEPVNSIVRSRHQPQVAARHRWREASELLSPLRRIPDCGTLTVLTASRSTCCFQRLRPRRSPWNKKSHKGHIVALAPLKSQAFVVCGMAPRSAAI
jgi:hypothetical protein